MTKYILLLAICLSLSASAKSQNKNVMVPCDMLALNREYIKLVQQQRTNAYRKPVQVTFDKNMFYHTYLHNIVMERTDSLFHDYLTFNAEMVGAILNIEEYKNNPAKLAKYIFDRFNESKAGHHETQIDITNTYVSVTCTERYFVVRMNSRPDGVAKPISLIADNSR